ncbi:MAG: pyridoxal 5'-phosphate synthase glutaminase subunit PdxT [Candidatus Marinimicrobia bacterium]|nr:pyridoxal 5'-phosphate synthase glutaminase subunit PdxT [Candidatus Neomarinimicrobiota bacterium]MCF7828998.1 pyridoxal 5'-phosphate synthase glutaminase subunit PdxT [Candidatus Neomarinimicrobiota bacterium]MCF7879958.1 pyridoxal 5'-phosphate synthase glutaminase subunit PdxT [Candidatus Neomarinimicrobiota bacterium]
MIVGILAIQGAFHKHQQVLERLGVQSRLIKHPGELDEVDALIIPGGESTTMTKVLQSEKWSDVIELYARDNPVFGTCAGAILLSNQVDSDKVKPWHIIDMSVSRNAFGRQIESFLADIDWGAAGESVKIPAVFIRAPRINKIGDRVEILGRYEGEPVVVRQGNAMAATFHPELTNDIAVHRYFIDELCRKAQAA